MLVFASLSFFLISPFSSDGILALDALFIFRYTSEFAFDFLHEEKVLFSLLGR